MSQSVEIVEPRVYIAVVADEIVASIRDAISDHGRCSIALSGGSTPGAIYRALSRPPSVNDVEWDKVDMYWGDERWVPLDHTSSNYRMTQETLLAHIPQPGPRIHHVRTDLESPEEGAKDYEEQIRKAEGAAAGEIPVFDIVLLGVGEDGHTASIFPKSPVIHEKSAKLCFAVEHPEGGYRVTMSPGLLFSARRVMFIVKGESKADIVSHILEGSASVEETPALLYREATGRVSWFLDSSAALKLDKARYA